MQDQKTRGSLPTSQRIWKTLLPRAVLHSKGDAGGPTCPAVHLSGSKRSKISSPGCPERREDVNPGPRLLPSKAA